MYFIFIHSFSSALFSLCGSEFLNSIIFLFPEELILTCLSEQVQGWGFFFTLHHESLAEFLNMSPHAPRYVDMPLTVGPNSFLLWHLISSNLSALPLSIPICLRFLLQINRFWLSFTCFSIPNRETFGGGWWFALKPQYFFRFKKSCWFLDCPDFCLRENGSYYF